MRITAGMKRIDKRRMEELRDEVGVRESHKEVGEELDMDMWKEWKGYD